MGRQGLRLAQVDREHVNGKEKADLSCDTMHMDGWKVPCEWNTFTVLEKCQNFYINSFVNMQNYMKIKS
jgi:hypothetical protein